MLPELHSHLAPLPQSEDRSWRKLGLAIFTAVVLLALPITYLVVHYGHPTPVSASSMPAQAPLLDIAGLEEAARAHPTIANRINLSFAYIQAGRPALAIPVLNAVVAESSGNALAWNNLCVAHTLQADYPAAIEDCHKALRIQPDFQLAQNNLKWAEDELRKTQNAIAQAEQFAPASRSANDYIAEGMNYLRMDSYDQAIKSWQRALQIDPKSAIAANNIGTAYMFKKEPATALIWFEKALVLDPTLQIAKNNLAWAHSEIAHPSK